MATTIPNTYEAWEILYWAFYAYYSKTTYAVGTFGSSLDYKGNLAKITKSGWNADHKGQIYADAAEGQCFAFDCIGYVKGTGWWGWGGRSDLRYGGATYKSNNMPDCSVHAFFRDYCFTRQKITKDTKTVPIGTYCGLNDWSHIAIAAGNNTVLEATRYGTHNVRRARIAGLPTIKEFEKLPEREFDFYAYCKYVSFEETSIITDESGRETLIADYCLDNVFGVDGKIYNQKPVYIQAVKIKK